MFLAPPSHRSAGSVRLFRIAGAGFDFLDLQRVTLAVSRKEQEPAVGVERAEEEVVTALRMQIGLAAGESDGRCALLGERLDRRGGRSEAVRRDERLRRLELLRAVDECRL